MDPDEPIHKGYLSFPPNGKILKKAWQKKYCILYKKSSTGIGRLEIYESETKSGQVKIITLEDVIKISTKSHNIINIVTKNSDVEFGIVCDDFLIWYEALKCVSFPDEDSQNGIEEDNDLYCSAVEGNKGEFTVRLHPSEASQRCNLVSKNYTIVIGKTELQLRNEEDNKRLYTWPFSYIRKYGYKGGKFTFEAGRKCSSGEGVFYFEHPNHHEIYRCLSTRMKNMKKLLNGESTPSLIDCGDFLDVALTMEAGSRHPLFVSKGSLYTPSIDSIKSIPNKPPRKFPPPKTSIVRTEYAEISEAGKYDTVEDRRDAWKTLGMQEPPHSEQMAATMPEEVCEAWGTSGLKKCLSDVKLASTNSTPTSEYFDCVNEFSKASTFNSSFKQKKSLERSKENVSHDPVYVAWGDPFEKPIEAPTVISEPAYVDSKGYDRLNFFGSSTLVPSANYTQVFSKGNVSSTTANSSFNHYEEVNVLEPSRKADDSYLGYAVIKKDSGSLKQVPSVENLNKERQRVAHQFENNQPYAMISRPKRV